MLSKQDSWVESPTTAPYRPVHHDKNKLEETQDKPQKMTYREKPSTLSK
jgi:hypothetical protein